MAQGTDHRADRLFWWTIAFGLFVPVLVVQLAAAVLAGRQPVGRALAELPMILFGPGQNLFVIVLLTEVPFLALAFLIRGELRGHGNEAPDARIKRVARVVGAVVSVTGFILAVQIDIWVRTEGIGKGVSTAAIGLLFLPFEALLVLVAGYYAGGLVGWAVARWRGRAERSRA
jgi:hypothetical protein